MNASASSAASAPSAADDRATVLLRLLQLTDSALPVGAFSCSNGLETAVAEGLVHDAATLEAFTEDLLVQSAFTDGVAALHAHRSRLAGDVRGIVEADRYAFETRTGGEGRLMTCRMGRKLAELAARLFADALLDEWLEALRAGVSPGTYPAAQGLVFAASGIDERALFVSQQYGVASMALNAALRCLRVSHYDTQRILFRLSERGGALYEEACVLALDEMHAFVPQIDILASLHEQGTQRLFMN